MKTAHKAHGMSAVALAVVVGMGAAAWSPQAEANLEAAMSRLAGSSGSFTTTSEGSFRAATRQGWMGGGVSMRFSHGRYSLVNITPPELTIGCNGIDGHLGGFSFINSEQIQQMLEQIMQGVVAMAFQTALKALCPICADVLEMVEGMARWATQFSMDTCQMSQSIFSSLQDGSMSLPQISGRNLWCNSINLVRNAESDWFASQQQSCADEGRTRSRVAEDMASGTDGDRDGAVAVHGNTLWKAMQASGLAPRSPSASNAHLRPYAELVMSMVGTSVNNPPEEDGGADGRSVAYPPVIGSPELVLTLFMCGSDIPSPSGSGVELEVTTLVAEYCGERLGGAGAHGPMVTYRCNDVVECMQPRTADVTSLGLGEGFLVYVARTLADAVNRVATDQPLTDPQKALIAAAPFPLYRAVNVAATHPHTAENLVVGHSMVLGHMIASTWLRRVIMDASQSAERTNLPEQLMRDLFASMRDIEVAANDVAERIHLFSNFEETIMRQVNIINQGIARHVQSTGISGADFARDLAHQNP